MNLTRFTDYSLRILMFLAVQPVGQLPNIKQISKIYQISNNHLVKIVHELGKLGYLETIRGRNGGIRLARPAETISVGEVVRKTEENWHLVECFDGSSEFCIINPVCRLKGVLHEALEAFFTVLDKYTLADLAVNRENLASYLVSGLSVNR